MKNFKNALKMFSILLLLLSTSCKKDEIKLENKPEPTVNPIAATELLDYYLVAEHKAGAYRMMVAYFELSGNKVIVRAMRQGNPIYPGIETHHEVMVDNGRINIDWNGDGRTAMYRFTIEKDASGKLTLKNYDFQFNGEGNLLNFAVLAKKTEALPFENFNFKMAAVGQPFEAVKNGIPLTFSKFMGGKVLYWPTKVIVTEQVEGYDNILNIGFLTTTYTLGVTVPYWKGINTPIMLIEIDSLLFMAAKQ